MLFRSGIFPISPDFIAEQIKAVCSDIHIDAVKLGMLHNGSVLERVADLLEENSSRHIIVDPVMVATSGDSLTADTLLDLYIKRLFPIATLLTPNTYEASLLSGMRVETLQDLYRAGEALLELGCNGVLMKGGHLEGDRMTDLLLIRGEKPLLLENKKINTPNTHGTGCTLSSAIAAYLALGYSLKDAVIEANRYVNQAILSGASVFVGSGHGPLNHFFSPHSLNIKKQLHENKNQ